MDSPTYCCRHQPISLCSLTPRLPWPRYICRRGHIQVFSLGSPTPSLRSLASSRPYLSQRWHKLWVMSMCHMELPSKRRGQHFQVLNDRNDIHRLHQFKNCRQGSLAEWYQVFQLAGVIYLVTTQRHTHQTIAAWNSISGWCRHLPLPRPSRTAGLGCFCEGPGRSSRWSSRHSQTGSRSAWKA